MLVAVAAFAYFSTAAPDRDNLATAGLVAIVEGSKLRVVDSGGDNAGTVDSVPVDGHVAWSTDAASLGYGRGDTLYWSPANLQFSRKIGAIVPGSRFFWSPSGREVLVQTGAGVAIVDKAGKQIWKLDGVKPLGWWSVTGIVGSAVVVSDGTKTRIVSTYNNEALWTFDVPAAVPSPASPALLLQRAEGWSIWEPLSGARPVPGVAASATAAWEPDGRRVAIESSASGGVVIVNVADLKTSPLGVSGSVVGWVGDQIAVTRDGTVRLVRPGSRDTKDLGGGTSASLQPAAPKPASAAKPGPVNFVPVAALRGGGLSVAVAPHPDGQILYIVDLAGRVVADRGGSQTTVLDIRDRVTAWDESGLLDIVLHPKFPRDRTAYVYYGVGGVTDKGDIGPRRNVIASFELTADGLSAVPGSFRERYSLPIARQTRMNHNGGTLAFAPDGTLYFAFGDLGEHEPAGDPDPRSPHGSFFTVNVDQAGGWSPAKIAYGFRNPFRFAVDPITTQVWIGDVGGITREEIDVLTRGGNFGWPLREGEVCRSTLTDCDAPGIPPVHAWPPYSGGHPCGAGVIGGFVYRGSAMPALRGWYIYSDLCSGDILAIDPASATPEPVALGRVPGAPTAGAVVDLVPDLKGEPLAVGMTGGVWRLTPAGN